MSKSQTAQMNALTIIGIDTETFTYVLEAPEKPVDLMNAMRVAIVRDGFAKATEVFLSCHWLRIDPSTKEGDDKYAVAGYGIALPKNCVALRVAKASRPLGRFIKMTKDYLVRHTLRTTDNHGRPCDPFWSKAGANATVALNYKKNSRAMGSKPAQKKAPKPRAKQTTTARTKKTNGKFSVVMTNEQVIADGRVMAKGDPKRGAEYVLRYYKGSAEDALAELLAVA